MRSLVKSFLTLLLSFSIASCEHDSPIVPDTRVALEGVITIDFPPGTLNREHVKITKVDDADIKYIFDETAALFNVGNILSYQIRVDMGQSLPDTDEIVATFSLPSNFLGSIRADYGVELFALAYQDGGDEILDLFDILQSAHTDDGRTLIAKLPTWAFTNKRNAGQTFEAIFMIASTPGDNSSGRVNRPSDGDECKAGQISCPLGSVASCSENRSSRFGIRTDPVTGKLASVHWGTDFAVALGTKIHSASDGVIEKIWTQKDLGGAVTGYGLYVVLRHLNGSATLYAHLSQTKVVEGQVVRANQLLALSGNSGKSTGPHLHFEYVPNGKIIQSKGRIDPIPCISSGNAMGSITVRDNGTSADDAFAIYLEGIFIGRTEVGQSNSLALSNLRSGEKQLKVKCTIAPDDMGTYEILFDDGILFADGASSKSGILPQGGTVEWTIVIPKDTKGGRLSSANRPTPQPNAYIEK